MSDYERGVRDAMKFYHTHTTRHFVESDNIVVVPASEKALAYFGTRVAEQVWTDAAVAALVKSEVAA